MRGALPWLGCAQHHPSGYARGVASSLGRARLVPSSLKPAHLRSRQSEARMESETGHPSGSPLPMSPRRWWWGRPGSWQLPVPGSNAAPLPPGGLLPGRALNPASRRPGQREGRDDGAQPRPPATLRKVRLEQQNKALGLPSSTSCGPRSPPSWPTSTRQSCASCAYGSINSPPTAPGSRWRGTTWHRTWAP